MVQLYTKTANYIKYEFVIVFSVTANLLASPFISIVKIKISRNSCLLLSGQRCRKTGDKRRKLKANK